MNCFVWLKCGLSGLMIVMRGKAWENMCLRWGEG